MDSPSYSILETKILQAVNLIHELRRENEKLKHELELLRLELNEKKREISNLKQALDQQPSPDLTLQQYQEREAQIRSKIEKMLAKLEALDIPI
ncbi:MAG: hypothetical protein Q9P14_04205 [candidate division KSB1 bacterium]|nr:hypothetical protein [candidate division KSB1 bacterium]MDQ7062710.1 hypothetical protein [candidate division KSB1 bacterium]